jgi:hypothetical protein
MWLGAPALKMQMTLLAPVPLEPDSAERDLPAHQAVTMAGADFNQPRRDGVMRMTSEPVGVERFVQGGSKESNPYQPPGQERGDSWACKQNSFPVADGITLGHIATLFGISYGNQTAYHYLSGNRIETSGQGSTLQVA